METIKSSAEITRLFNKGLRQSCPSVTILVAKSTREHDPSGRVAFIAGKKLGGAVWRNQAKRRLRAVCRDIGGPWPGFDVVFIARLATTQASYSTVCKQCSNLIAQALGECDE